MMIVGAPLVVIFATSITIVCSKRFRITVTHSSTSSGSSYSASRKEVRRADQIHIRNGAILSSHWNSYDCATSSVYTAGGDRYGAANGGRRNWRGASEYSRIYSLPFSVVRAGISVDMEGC